ncbi:MAG: YbaN family protein [bacterium]|nr:YbaN family protein [bacterium]
MRNITRLVCTGLGLLLLGIGCIGIVVPVLPTTPFLLAAVFFFAKGSIKFHDWFLRTKLYQHYIINIVVKKEMTRKSKIIVLGTITGLLIIVMILAPIWHIKALIVVIALLHYYYFLFRMKTDDQ